MEDEERRFHCFLVGSMLGQESVEMADALTAYSSVSRYTDIGEAIAETWIAGVRKHRDALAKLVPQAVSECGLQPAGEVVEAWDEADRLFRRLVDAPTENAAQGAYYGSLRLVQATQKVAKVRGIDPPLFRNLRRIVQSTPEKRG
jgi:hypothetical protein